MHDNNNNYNERMTMTKTMKNNTRKRENLYVTD